MDWGNMADQKKDGTGKKLSYDRAAGVLKMLEDIPEDLRDIFTPATKDELVELEINISNFRSRAKEREKVMQLQRQHNLPLRPNQTLEDVTKRIRIQQLKKRRRGGDMSDDAPGLPGVG